MKKEDYHIEGMTMAIKNMAQMLDFYSNTFDIQFSEKELFGDKLYAGVWGGLNLLFCPATLLAKNTAEQNRHQFDIVVADLQKVIEITEKYGGQPMSEVVEDEHAYSVGIYDPDNNSILFKQLKAVTDNG